MQGKGFHGQILIGERRTVKDLDGFHVSQGAKAIVLQFDNPLVTVEGFQTVARRMGGDWEPWTRKRLQQAAFSSAWSGPCHYSMSQR